MLFQVLQKACFSDAEILLVDSLKYTLIYRKNTGRILSGTGREKGTEEPEHACSGQDHPKSIL
jgi:hypothetical protein